MVTVKENVMKRIKQVFPIVLIGFLFFSLTVVTVNMVHSVRKSIFGVKTVYAATQDFKDTEYKPKVKKQGEITKKYDTELDKEKNVIVIKEMKENSEEEVIISEIEVNIITYETNIIKERESIEEEPKKVLVKRYNGEEEISVIVDAEIANKSFVSQFGASEEYVYILSEQEKIELAKLIFAEAGNQGLEGQVAVGAVVMNRLYCNEHDFGNTIHDVITKGGQFTDISHVSNKQLETCMEAVEYVCKGWDPTRTLFENGALYFYSAKGADLSGRKKVSRLRIEGHFFTYKYGK